MTMSNLLAILSFRLQRYLNATTYNCFRAGIYMFDFESSHSNKIPQKHLRIFHPNYNANFTLCREKTKQQIVWRIDLLQRIQTYLGV